MEFCNSKLRNNAKIVVASMGPIVNIGIALITLLLQEFEYKTLIIYSNILIASFNLIPIYPLDGGRIAKAILKKFYKEETVCTLINIITNISMVVLTATASIGILYLKNIAILFIIAYLWIIVIIENRKYQIKKRMYKILKEDKEKMLLYKQ